MSTIRSHFSDPINEELRLRLRRGREGGWRSGAPPYIQDILMNSEHFFGGDGSRGVFHFVGVRCNCERAVRDPAASRDEGYLQLARGREPDVVRSFADPD